MTTLTLEERFEAAKVVQPARCLWAWRYEAVVDKRFRLDHRQGWLVHLTVPKLPVETLLGVGGWTFCGRHTIRALTLNEARDIEAAGIGWHLWENEPADALPATDELKTLEEAQAQPPDDGVFRMSHAAMYGRAPEATCARCLVNLDKAQEVGHLKVIERLAEAVLLLNRPGGGVPKPEWWTSEGLYRP